MKTILIILLLPLCSYGQNGTFKIDTAKTASSDVWKFSGYNNYLIKPSIPKHYYTATVSKVIIKVSPPDSVGLVKVWINRKEITWTSDSTFTYKTEQ